ncbi:hypothetical protein SLEP1_g40826 [Rubroshorea leprosula]|uniref:Integrase catalytic domain-containing protein n=1 Tax=Rubroshorea leprosula TaxID=152421 RepID=A0AAV5L4S5_9ROSI|nr:hypothetical protein SLEP1_g40826 [Rubroshorea leprosula]
MKLFSKSLTSTDVRRRLAIPTKIVNSLLPNGGDHAVELHMRHSNHMCGDKSAFLDLDESCQDKVKFGDNSTIAVKGKGKVTIRAKDNSIQTISHVLYVPDLKSNLLSLGQLQEKGYEILIKDGVCQIRDSKLGLIAKALQQKKMVNGLPHFDSPSEICEICVVSKKHRDSFPKDRSWKAKQVLDLVHSDLCEPINPTSNGGKQYFITFVDDYSRKTWVYFLQTKSETLAAFKNFKVLAENEVGRSVKVLRTDRGGEFNSKEFADFCESNGIKRQLIAAYAPQQNGVCERRNHTIMNMVRSLMSKSGLPKEFWPEAVNWSVHILNRSPTSPLPNLMPEEAWSGRRLAVDYFRIFGCIAYVHVPDQKGTEKSGQQILADFENGEDLTVQNSECQTSADLKVSRQTAEEILPTEVEFSTGGSLPTTLELESGTSSRPQRKKRRPAWLEDYEVTDLPQDDVPVNHFALFVDCDPLTYEEAVKEEKWQKAMAEEIGSIERNQTGELTDLPEGHKTIGVKWIYKTKLKENGMVDKFKARLVAKVTSKSLALIIKKFLLQLQGWIPSDWKVFKSALMSIHFTSNLEMEEVLDRFQMKNCNSVTTPIDKGVKLVKDPRGKSVDSKLYKQIVGSLMYLTATRLDIMHGVSLISRYMEHPKELHLQTAKRILRYLCGTVDFGLLYKKGDQIDLAGFTDSDYAGDLDDRKSTSGIQFEGGSADSRSADIEEDKVGYLDYRIEVKRADKPSLKHSLATVGNLPTGNSGETTCILHPSFEDGVVKLVGVSDEKVEKSSFKLFGVNVVEKRQLVDTSYEVTADKTEIGAQEDKEFWSGSVYTLDLTLVPPEVNGPR